MKIKKSIENSNLNIQRLICQGTSFDRCVYKLIQGINYYKEKIKEVNSNRKK